MSLSYKFQRIGECRTGATPQERALNQAHRLYLTGSLILISHSYPRTPTKARVILSLVGGTIATLHPHHSSGFPRERNRETPILYLLTSSLPGVSGFESLRSPSVLDSGFMVRDIETVTSPECVDERTGGKTNSKNEFQTYSDLFNNRINLSNATPHMNKTYALCYHYGRNANGHK